MDTSGARRGNLESGELSAAAQAARGRKTIVLVPGTDAVLAEPVLPLKSGAKLAQVVPFALEEQLATDVEDLHFALGKREGRPGTPVTVVSHERMQAWRSALSAAGLDPEALYAETAGIPETPNSVTLLIDGGRVYVRREASPGAVLEVEPLIEALQLARFTSGSERDLLEGLREFTASLQLKLLPDGPLPLIASHVLRGTPVNLLQGRYAVKRKLQISLAPWRYAAVLAAVFVACHLGLKAWQYFHYRSVEARLDAQIAEVFQQAMPGAPVPEPLAARRMVEARLAQLRGTGPVSEMMTTLAMLSEAIASTPDTRIEALSYRNNTTDLRVLAPSVDALDRIRQVAAQRGMNATLESANPRDSKFEGRLQFKPSGA
jgi:general secretion pathway protein L